MKIGGSVGRQVVSAAIAAMIVWTCPSASAQTTSGEQLRQAAAAVAAGRNVDALAMFAEAIEAAPTGQQGYLARAQLFESLGYPDLAARDLRQATKLEPPGAELLTNLCRDLALANHDLDGALAACNAAVKLAPEDAAALGVRGYLNLRRAAYSAAEKDFAAALNFASADPDFTFGRGLALIHLGNVKEGRGEISIATLDRASLVSDWEARGFGMQGELIAGRPLTKASQPSISTSDHVSLLNPDEQLVRLASGCALVTAVSGALQTRGAALATAGPVWSGECRFGLANGAGKLAPSPGAEAFPATALYGRLISPAGASDGTRADRLKRAYAAVEAALAP